MSQEQEERYADMLDECYPRVSIGTAEWSASYALKNLDPVAWRCGYVDWLDAEDEEEDEEWETYQCQKCAQCFPTSHEWADHKKERHNEH